MARKLPTVSIIIATYNRGLLLEQTIQAFANQNYPHNRFEIIIADNASTDDTAKIVKRLVRKSKNARIRYLLEARPGNHYARNSAVKKSSADIVYFADDDVLPDHNLLKEVVWPFSLDKDVATVTGRVLPRWETSPPRWVAKYMTNSLLSLMDPPEDLIITSQLNLMFSCHQAIRRDIYIEIEGFNPEQFGRAVLGDGESGLNAKIRSKNYKFAYNGKAITYHMVPTRRMNQTYLKRRIEIGGFEHAYRAYRRDEPTQFGLFIINLRLLFIDLPKHLLSYAFNIFWHRDPQLARFFIPYTFYYRNRIWYNTQLRKSSVWRQFVLKQDWYSNDEDLPEEIADYVKEISKL